MMLRFNMLLLVVAVACALGVVTAQHRARKLFQAMEAEQVRAQQLEVEYDQLQLELSTWAAHPRVEKIARERLKMGVPVIVARNKPPVKPLVSAARPAASVPSGAAAVKGGR